MADDRLSKARTRMTTEPAAVRYGLVSLALLFLGLFLVAPLVTVFASALEKGVGVYLAAIREPETLDAIRLTLFTAAIAVPASLVFGLAAAWAIAKFEFPGKYLLITLIDLPFAVSPVIAGMTLVLLFGARGALGPWLDAHGIKVVFAVPGIVLAQFTIVSALAIRLLKSTFDNIDPRYEQVGRTLGYSKFGAFIRVTIPRAKDGLIAAGILTWARAVGEFGATVMLAGATAMKTETLPVAIFLSLATADVEKAVAVILILIIIAVIALVVIRQITGKRFSI